MEPVGKGYGATQLMKGRPDSTDNAEDCSVCMMAFDDTLSRPRNLPCGHTFCTPCINGLKDQGEVMCPTCRVTHIVPEAGQFPISYTIEAIIRRLRDAATTSPPFRPGKDTGEPESSLVGGLGQKGSKGFSSPVRSILQEQEAKIIAAIRICQEVQVQLDQYLRTLAGWGERQQNFEDRLQALVDQSKDTRVLLRQEESKAATKKEQVQQGERQLHTMLQKLRTIAIEQEVWGVVNDADDCVDEEGQRAEECQGMFPDVHTVTTINKVAEVSNAALEAATTVQAAQEAACGTADPIKDPRLLTAEEFSITDKTEALLSPTLQIEDLRSLTQTARRLLKAGLVFAVHEQEGRSRHARITFEGSRLYLHSLQDQQLLPSAVTVQMHEVVPATPQCLVFLDLAWPCNGHRRVLIRVDTGTPLGRQFLLLCTGQRGPCYANTKLLEVRDKGRPGERVFGGDYEYNNGTGGAAVLHDLEDGEYRRSCRAGDVWWWCDNPAQGAQFRISIRSWKRDGGVPRVFGEVVEGFEGLEAAAQHIPIEEVTVIDCGVIL